MSKPRPYDLTDPEEVARLYREVCGYLHTCRLEHHGTDTKGREYAIQAMDTMRLNAEAKLSVSGSSDE